MEQTDRSPTELEAARATNQRLNLRAQRLESELATYRRAVAQWEVSERGTYVPLRTIAAIAKAAGRDIEHPRWLMHYQRVEQAEAAIACVRAEVARWKLNTLEPQTMRALDDIDRALRGPSPAHNAGPTVREAAADDRRWPLEKAGE